jgi:hypothetical protein
MNAFRKLLKGLFTPKAPRPQPSRRLWLEALEDRLAPATINYLWNPNGTGNAGWWEDGRNWTVNGTRQTQFNFPGTGADDTAKFDGGVENATDVSLNSTRTLDALYIENGWTRLLELKMNAGDLTVKGGDMTSGANIVYANTANHYLTIAASSTFTWSAGDFNASDSHRTDGNAKLTVNGELDDTATGGDRILGVQLDIKSGGKFKDTSSKNVVLYSITDAKAIWVESGGTAQFSVAAANVGVTRNNGTDAAKALTVDGGTLTIDTNATSIDMSLWSEGTTTLNKDATFSGNSSSTGNVGIYQDRASAVLNLNADLTAKYGVDLQKGTLNVQGTDETRNIYAGNNGATGTIVNLGDGTAHDLTVNLGDASHADILSLDAIVVGPTVNSITVTWKGADVNYYFNKTSQFASCIVVNNPTNGKITFDGTNKAVTLTSFGTGNAPTSPYKAWSSGVGVTYTDSSNDPIPAGWTGFSFANPGEYDFTK